MTMEERRAQLLQDPNLYPSHIQTPEPRDLFGEVPDFPVGSKWASRKKCYEAGVHRALVAGIHGTGNGAFSIVLSNSYEDDTDYGETFIYTGAGGRGPGSAYGEKTSQVEDQSFSHPHNVYLVASKEHHRPVRVIRGANPHSKYAPKEGFRYDGLYDVVDAAYDKGVSGFKVCKFYFRRREGQLPIPQD